MEEGLFTSGVQKDTRDAKCSRSRWKSCESLRMARRVEERWDEAREEGTGESGDSTGQVDTDGHGDVIVARLTAAARGPLL